MNICHAEDLEKYLNGRALNVIETNTEINIYMRVGISGPASKYMLPRTAITYEAAFFKGVKDMWEGVYNGKNVNVITEQVDSDDTRKHISVIFDTLKNMQSISCALKLTDTIWLYSGDGRDIGSLFYTYSRFNYVCGHEMGHILGLGDAYTDESIFVRTKLKTPMNSEEIRHAQPVDYYMLLKYRTWERDDVFIYSHDSDIARFYSK